MSTYLDLVAVINNLSRGVPVEITVKWCTDQGLIVTPSIAKKWGKLVYDNHQALGLLYHGKSSNNLHHYSKI